MALIYGTHGIKLSAIQRILRKFCFAQLNSVCCFHCVLFFFFLSFFFLFFSFFSFYSTTRWLFRTTNIRPQNWPVILREMPSGCVRNCSSSWCLSPYLEEEKKKKKSRRRNSWCVAVKLKEIGQSSRYRLKIDNFFPCFGTFLGSVSTFLTRFFRFQTQNACQMP